ncbi:hypothetical protein PGIGA_G00012250 [Pangasianodon gigas]|uniref:Uncharacterized protein n=1 Tax=Pangasianodon gigas TaxID=30993 RepID=A0ACC5W771_PANGG|nr:hypothetical protein [Pangasianodon gigas]
MCHIPVFCWISATVLERMLGEAESGEIPKTLTQMFTHFLIFQIKHKDQKYHQKCNPDPQKTRESVLALGKLAFQQLEKGNLIFYEEDLRECGIDVREVSVYSGVCTQIFREEFGLHLGKVFSFVHLSVQEFLAALYEFLSFINKNNATHQTWFGLFTKSNMSDFLRSAVDKALQSENGHLDLFLRFLLGLSLESNQTLLRGLMPQTGSSSHFKQETVEYIKEKIRENPSPEKSINLFHCLNELNDHSLVQEVQHYLNRGDYSRLSGVSLSPAQWSALVFVLLNSDENLDEFNLSKYHRSEKCLLRLLPVVKASRKAEALRKLQVKDPRQVELEQLEQGFCIYINGANSNLANAKGSRRASHRHTHTADAPRRSTENTCGVTHHIPRSHTAPERAQRREWVQKSIHIRTESGGRVKISPEDRYSDDFEPYESVDMEAGREVCKVLGVKSHSESEPAERLLLNLDQVKALRRSLEASVKRSSHDSAGEESEDEWVEEQIERDDSNDSISDITLPPSPKPSQPIRSQPSSSDLIVLDFGPSPIGMSSLLKTDQSESCVFPFTAVRKRRNKTTHGSGLHAKPPCTCTQKLVRYCDAIEYRN